MTIPTLKELTIEVIKTSADNVSYDKLKDKIRMVAEVLEGLQNSKDGKTLTTEQLLQRINSW